MKMWNRFAKGAVVFAAGCFLSGLALSAAQADDAKDVYTKNCVSCHGAAGKGDGPAAKMLKPPPGDFGTTLKAMSDADIEKVVKEGGKAVGKAASMPGYAKKLSDDQIKALVPYMKGLK